MNSIFQKIQELKGKVKLVQKRDPATIEELEKLYSLVYKSSIRKGCGDCAVSAFAKLTRLTEGQVNEMSDRKFHLKKGVAIQKSFGSAEVISNDNLTDQKAIELLRRRPNLINQFDKYPTDEFGNPSLEISSGDEEKEESGSNEVDQDDLTGEHTGKSVGHPGERSDGETEDKDAETGDQEPTDDFHQDSDEGVDEGQLRTTSTGEADQPSETDVRANAEKEELTARKADLTKTYSAMDRNTKLSAEGKKIREEIASIDERLAE